MSRLVSGVVRQSTEIDARRGRALDRGAVARQTDFLARTRIAWLGRASRRLISRSATWTQGQYRLQS